MLFPGRNQDEEGDITDVLMGNTSVHHKEFAPKVAQGKGSGAPSSSSSAWRHGHRRGGPPDPAATAASRAQAKRAALAGGGGGLWEGAEGQNEYGDGKPIEAA